MSPPPRPPLTASSSTPETAKPSRAASRPPVRAPITMAARSTEAGIDNVCTAARISTAVDSPPPIMNRLSLGRGDLQVGGALRGRPAALGLAAHFGVAGGH